MVNRKDLHVVGVLTGDEGKLAGRVDGEIAGRFDLAVLMPGGSQLAGGIRTAIFGGEGLFLATMTGPGKVIVQSMTLERMRRELAPSRSSGDEKSPLESITNIWGSED